MQLLAGGLRVVRGMGGAPLRFICSGGVRNSDIFVPFLTGRLPRQPQASQLVAITYCSKGLAPLVKMNAVVLRTNLAYICGHMLIWTVT